MARGVSSAKGATVTRREVLGVAASMAACAAKAVRAAGEDGFEEVARQTWRHAGAVPIDTRALQLELIRYATLAANGHNTQPWKFRPRIDGIDIVPDFARRTPAVDPDDHHLWTSLGCATENLVQAAAAFGQYTEVSVLADGVHLTFTRTPARRSALFDAIPHRQSTRAEYDGQALDNDTLRRLEGAAAVEHVHTLLLTAPEKIAQVQDYVLAGNAVQMADAAFVAEVKAWLRFNEHDAVASRDGLFAAASGNPTLPRWLGSLMFDLFFTARGENQKYAKQLHSSAGVAVLVAERADPVGWVAVGRAAERLLLQATALDVCTAFINQPVEVRSLRSQFAMSMGLAGRRPDLVVRFGRGHRLPPSLRRPVEAVLIA